MDNRAFSLTIVWPFATFLNNRTNEPYAFVGTEPMRMGGFGGGVAARPEAYYPPIRNTPTERY